MREVADFIKGMLSSTGVHSFARSGCMFIIYFKVVESLYIVSKTTAIPDIPPAWAALIATLYGASKWMDVYSARNKDTVAIAKGVTDADGSDSSVTVQVGEVPQ